MTCIQFQVDRNDLSVTRLKEIELPEIQDGEVLVRIEKFALTANNITYGVVGEKIGYWQFFPVEQSPKENWGIVPAWGFAEVIQSRNNAAPEGTRLYGYFPMATHMIMRPRRTGEKQLSDASAHRAKLPPVYNSYAVAGGKNALHDNERCLLQPLFITSYCLYDFLVFNSWFGADQVIIVSASGKTSIGLGYALAGDSKAPNTVGITSAGNVSRVRELALYDAVLAYDDIASVDASLATVIVDMSGSGSVLARLHRHLGENMKFCSNVGLSHWSANTMEPGFIRERSEMFFAPGHIRKRAEQSGAGVFEREAGEFWRSAAEKSRSWLEITTVEGLAQAAETFEELRQGKVAPESGLIVKL